MGTTFLFLSLLASLVTSVVCTKRPIIGVLAQEFFDRNGTFISASYVKMVEASGARVVPIFTLQNQKYYTELLSSINGVVFPGGSVDFSKNGGFVKAGNLVYIYAKKMANANKKFPILGVCQGLELLAYLSNNKNNPLVECAGVGNSALPLEFIVDYKNTSLYGKISKEDYKILSTKNVTSNHHRWCLTEEKMKNTGLDKKWRTLTVNHDKNGLRFVSSMESTAYPFAAVQFHPEKISFEWRPDETNPHFPESVRANRIFYDWLVTEARQSDNSFVDSKSEMGALIYNYNPVFTGKTGGYDEQLYTFP